MVYDARQLIEDCASSAQGRAKGVNKDAYGKVWNELQHWISGQMDLEKGANIPSFGEFLWVKEGSNGGKAGVLKPEFKMSETFSRNHHLRPVTREATRTEPINFGKISGGLPKDKAVVCTRQLLSRLGEAIEQGKDVKLNFGVGTLQSRGRQVDFSFNGQYARGRPQSPVGAPPPRVPTLPSMGKQGEQGGGPGSTSGASRGGWGGSSSVASSAPSGIGRRSPGVAAAAEASARGDVAVGGGSGRRVLGPRVLPGSKDLRAPHMYQVHDAATQLALERHQYQKRQEADFDRETEANARRRKARLDHQARMIREGRKSEARQLATFLEQQMKEKQARTAKEREAAKVRPPSRLPTPQEVAMAQRKKQQERQQEYRKELLEQMSHKQNRKHAERLEEYLDYQDAQAAVEDDIMCEHMARMQHKEVVRTVLNSEWSQQVAEKRERAAEIKEAGLKQPVKGLLHDAATGEDKPGGGRRRRPVK